MIRYTLKCDHDHQYDSWFASSEAYDTLVKSGHLCCEICGSGKVEKALMMPQVTVREAETPPAGTTPETAVGSPAQGASAAPMLGNPSSELEAALSELRAQVEANSDYVGDSFAREARAMHLGEMPERPIYGQANAKEAKELIEDGVPVAPLPFRPSKKAN